MTQNNIQELNITMLGPSGVGKTSLLAAMYQQVQAIGNLTQLKPSKVTQVRLHDRLMELQQMANQIESTGTTVRTTVAPQSFIFELQRPNNPPFLRLKFQDYPGGYLADAEYKGQVIQFLKNANTVIIAIDAIALMESRGKWNERINKPGQIVELFQEVYKDLNERRLVILAPVKCETYLRPGTDPGKLLASVVDGYDELINFFQTPELQDKVAVVVTPVQTVGCVVLTEIQVVDGEPQQYRFHKTFPGAACAPQDGDQPLMYLLRFLLKLYIDKQARGGFAWLVNLFAQNDQLGREVNAFANNCKKDTPFAVLQGDNLLEAKL
ncbi:MAG: ATP-binding protein [Oscillatoria princeps RMCB-10]|jgi:hypothetical protein|nr:ATP-binding protein [Oscillatoria princeps RMCB-10]